MPLTTRNNNEFDPEILANLDQDNDSSDALYSDAAGGRQSADARGTGSARATDGSDSPPGTRTGTGTDTRTQRTEFTEDSYADALKYAAHTGKPILMIYGNPNSSNFAAYQRDILPKLKEKLGNEAVLVTVNSTTDAGRRLGREHYLHSSMYTMMLTVKQENGRLVGKDVRESRYVSDAAQFMPRYMHVLTDRARRAMDANGFPRRPEHDGESGQQTKELPKKELSKKETPKPRETKKEETKTTDTKPKQDIPLEPGVSQDPQGRFSRCVTNEKHVIEYRYNSTSKTPNTIVIDGKDAWVPDRYQSNVWHQFKWQNNQWVNQNRTWHGTMGPDDKTGEFIYKAASSNEQVRWPISGGTETIRSDNSAVTVDEKTKRILKVTRSDGSTVEPVYESGAGQAPVRYIEKFKDESGKDCTVTWKKKDPNDNSATCEWISDDKRPGREGQVRIGLNLSKDEELKYATVDSSGNRLEHTVKRNGHEFIYNTQTKATFEEHQGDTLSIRFGDKTLRQFGWTRDKDGNKELTSVKVTWTDGSVSNWKKVGPDKWTLNGGEPGNYRFELLPDKTYVYTELDKNLRKERTPDGQQRWVQTVDVPASDGQPAQQKKRTYLADAAGNVSAIEDPITGKTWKREGDFWVSGAEKHKGELEIGKNTFGFKDGRQSLVFCADKSHELKVGDVTVAKYQGDKLLELASPDGKTRRKFTWDGDYVTSETVIRPNETIVWTRQKTGDRYLATDTWRAQATSGVEYKERQGDLQFMANHDVVFKHSDGTTHTVKPKGEETIENSRRGYRVTYKSGVLDEIQYPDGTKRKFGWEPGQENKVLNSVVVKLPDGKTTYTWNKTSSQPEMWSCNGAVAERAHFELKPNLEYMHHGKDPKVSTLRQVDGTTVDCKANGTRVTSIEREVIKVQAGQDVIDFQRYNNYGRVNKIEESRGGVVLRTWTRQPDGTYTDGQGNTRTGYVQTYEHAQYAFVEGNGIRHIERPGQPSERRGTKEDFKNLVATIFDGATLRDLQGRIESFDAYAKAEGMPAKRLGDLYHELSEKLTSPEHMSSREAQLAEIRKALRPRPMLLERTANCSDRHATEVEAALSNIPQALRQVVMRNGYRFIAADTVEETMPNAAKIQPRGYKPGMTWANADGYNSPTRKESVAAERFRMQGSTAHTSRYIRGVVRHEFAHALDDSLSLQDSAGKCFSDTDLFVKAYNDDVAKIPNELVYMGGGYVNLREYLSYYIQAEEGKSAGTQGGRQECFADVAAMLLGGPCNNDRTYYLQKYFPNVCKVTKAKLNDLGAKLR